MSMNKKYRDHEKEAAIQALHGVAKGMTSEDGVLQFVNEMLTESEQLVIGRRVLIAQMLLTGHSQAEIKEKLHVSPNTFIRTRKWVEKQIPNYGEALKEAKRAEESRQKKRGGFEYINPFSFTGMKKKYPMHFLLFNIADELWNKGR